MDLKIHILIQLKYLHSLRCLEEEQVLIAVREAVFLLNDRVLFHLVESEITLVVGLYHTFPLTNRIKGTI